MAKRIRSTLSLGPHCCGSCVIASAQQWGVPASECKAENGTVVHAASGRKVNYGAVAAAAASVKLDAEPAIKKPEQFTLLGKP
jgi:isoquinoline 1-oxidoreductase beta subunit